MVIIGGWSHLNYDDSDRIIHYNTEKDKLRDAGNAPWICAKWGTDQTDQHGKAYCISFDQRKTSHGYYYLVSYDFYTNKFEELGGPYDNVTDESD